MKMNKPGQYHMVLGILWVIAGIVLTVIFSLIFGGIDNTAVIFWGAVVIGVLQALYGLGQFILFSVRGEDYKNLHYAKIELRALIRCMMAMASADQILDENEIELIRKICYEKAGIEIEDQTIIDISTPMKVKGYNFSEDLDSISNQIDPEFRWLIFKACCYIATADGDPSKEEAERASEIMSTLSLDKTGASSMYHEITGYKL